jgi:hypothetical protein
MLICLLTSFVTNIRSNFGKSIRNLSHKTLHYLSCYGLFFFNADDIYLDCRGHNSPGHELQDKEQVQTDGHVHRHYATGCRKAGQVGKSPLVPAGTGSD